MATTAGWTIGGFGLKFRHIVLFGTLLTEKMILISPSAHATDLCWDLFTDQIKTFEETIDFLEMLCIRFESWMAAKI